MSGLLVGLILVGLCDVDRSPDQPFLAFIIQTIKPRGPTHRPLPDHVVQVPLVPALLSFFFPFPGRIQVRQAHPQQVCVRQRGDPGFTRGFLHPPLEQDGLPVIAELGIAQG